MQVSGGSDSSSKLASDENGATSGVPFTVQQLNSLFFLQSFDNADNTQATLQAGGPLQHAMAVPSLVTPLNTPGVFEFRLPFVSLQQY
jgi:hypothetical protein